jgi:hypothetical protein
MDWTTWAPVLVPGVGGALGWALAGYFYRLVMSGNMVPRVLYLEQKEATSYWREAYFAERAKTERILIPLAQTTAATLRAIPQAPEEEAPEVPG